MKVTFEDLEDSLAQHGFTLKWVFGTYEVTPTAYPTPVYKFSFLGEVECFHTGIEAQKRLSGIN